MESKKKPPTPQHKIPKTLKLVLEENFPEFPDDNVLFVDPAKLKRESYTDSNVSEDDVRTAIIYIQDMIVENVTGTCLFEQLKVLVCKKNISMPPYRWYKKLLDEYLLKIFIYGVQAELQIPKSFQLREQGVVQADKENLSVPSLKDIQALNDHYIERRNFYVKRAVDFLQCNSGCFRELCGRCSCGCDCERAPFQKVIDIGINLSKEPSVYDIARARSGKWWR